MFKVLTEGCEPTRGTKFSVCIDLYASEDVTIYAGETEIIGLGVCIDLDGFAEKHLKTKWVSPTETSVDEDDLTMFKEKHYLQLMLRSSLGKKGLILPNGVGVIDMDYRDEIKMLVHNAISDVHITDANTARPTGSGDEYKVEIKKGDKIGQITLLEHKGHLFGIETDTERNGGFGSTNKNDFYDLKDNEQEGRNL